MIRLRLCFIFLYFLKSSYGLEHLGGWNDINLHCRDNDHNPLDWWLLYKPPTGVGPYMHVGRNFTFITPDSGGRWQVSDRYITANSMVQNTLSPLFRPTYSDYLAAVVYVQGNDDSDPDRKGSSVYGILLADEMGGIWIVHTVPGLPDLTLDRPTFPEAEITNGHMVMCYSLDLIALNEVVAHIKLASPQFTYIRIPTRMTSSVPEWTYLQKDSSPVQYRKRFTPEPLDMLTKTKRLHLVLLVRPPGLEDCLYKSFAKDKNIVLDVFGHDDHIQPICQDSYSVRNIHVLSLKYPDQVYYIHSDTNKVGFAVSTAAHWQRSGLSSGQYWVCTSNVDKNEDLGGRVLLCIEDYNIWISFDHLKVKEPNC